MKIAGPIAVIIAFIAFLLALGTLLPKGAGDVLLGISIAAILFAGGWFIRHSND